MPLAVKYIVIALVATAINALSSMSAFANSGQTLYQPCTVCHGKSGEGNKALHAPALAGQFDWYLNRQILNFKQGLRGEHPNDIYAKPMLLVLNTLKTKQDIATLSQYIQSLPQVKQAESSEGNLKLGTSYYHGRCGACHGDQGQGNSALNAPKLIGLSSVYLKRQMEYFVKGIRGNHQQDKLGRQMAMMAKTTSDKELDDIIFYLSQL